MAKLKFTKKTISSLLVFLNKNKKTDVVSAYIKYLELNFNVMPIIYLPKKTIYMDLDECVDELKSNDELYRKTELKVSYDKSAVNDDTTKVYICPFSGKVFGNNTHPNPQDAIYQWVSQCPDNNEYVDGMKAKRFFISEDPKIIKGYINKSEKTITKTVFASKVNGKLFNSIEKLESETTKQYCKHFTLLETYNQNKFELSDEVVSFFQKYIDEDLINEFVDELRLVEGYAPFITKWEES